MVYMSRCSLSGQTETPSRKGVSVVGVVDGVVDSGMLRGSHRGLELAEGGRGLCRAQPVTGTAASTLGSTLIKG
jgi:hypothetical protein